MVEGLNSTATHGIGHGLTPTSQPFVSFWQLCGGSLLLDRHVVLDSEVEADDGLVAAPLHCRRQGQGARRRVRGVHADEDHVALRQRLPSVPKALCMLFVGVLLLRVFLANNTVDTRNIIRHVDIRLVGCVGNSLTGILSEAGSHPLYGFGG